MAAPFSASSFFPVEKQVNYSIAATISSGATASSTITQNGLTLVGIMLPAAFTGTTITFKASSDGTNFFQVYNSSGAVSYSVGASRYISINPADLQGIQYLQIVSGSSEAAQRALICSLKGI